jgi:hypothetical protein
MSSARSIVGVDVKLDLGHLHVERQVDQHRPRPGRAHQMEGLLEDAWYQRRFAHGHRPFGDRLGDALDIHRLEIFLVQARTRRLAGDAQNRNAVGTGRIQAGDHVGAGRARGADAHADVAGPCPGVALGHVRRAFDVARQDVRDGLPFAQCRVQRVDRRAGYAERLRDTFAFEHQDCRVDRSHFCHGRLLQHCLMVYLSVGDSLELTNSFDKRTFSRLIPYKMY